MRTTLSSILVAAAIAVATPMAQANPFYGVPAQLDGNLRFDGSVTGGWSGITIDQGSGDRGVLAGEFRGVFDPDGEDLIPGFEPDDFFRFFCVDLGQYVDSSSQRYTRHTGAFGTGNSQATDELSRLFDLFFPNKSTGVFYASGAQTNFGAISTTDEAAAFQLAVWNIWYDTDLSLSGGTFKASAGTVTTRAQQMLDAVAANQGDAGGWRLYTFTSESYQDYLSATYTEPRRLIPEPATLALLGLGLAGVGFSRRKTK